MATLDGLEGELLRIGSTYSGKWTYALTDMSSGQKIGHRQDDVMPTASLIKVPVLTALYRAVHEGRLRLTDRIRYGDEHRCLGSGVLSRLTPGVEMTVRDAAVLMIIISDNSATNIVIDLVGLDQVNETMRCFGLGRTTIFQRLGDTKAGLDARKMSVSTAGEMTRLLELIARHEAVPPEASEDMLRIMRRQDYRHELSRLLPWNEMNMLENHTENWVAEKGGSFLNGIRTSGAIFNGSRGKFVMSVFCEGGTGPGTGRESEGNRLNGELGYAAWRALAAG
ncbi:MAG: serine hydrolase [Chloroflexi bacterium]|jgi:beta-lactamase class A|nr:MAG: serine hydrolase [Chloroflexota bacterium]